MGVFEKLRRLFGGKDLVLPDAGSSPPPGAAADDDEAPIADLLEKLDAPARDPVSAWLEDTVARLAEGDAAAVTRASSPELQERLDALVAAGRTKLAAEWAGKFAVALPEGDARDDARARAAELRVERGESAEALPLLEALVRRPRHAARAHFLLGELHRRQGDRRAALRELEAALAIDVDFPNARVRADALRAQLGAAAGPSSALEVTIAGLDGQSATVGARYRLVRELGRGATGSVYLARDMDLSRDVAVKLLHPHLGQVVARFFAEARVAAALRHPNIVAVLDLDEKSRRIVMELAGGGTLKDRLRRGPLAPEAALSRHVEILSALAAAHRRGVVHRDLKPANLLFRRDPDAAPSEIVLCDFGVAHLGAARNEDGAVGTLLYMAPEQRRGDARPESDLWSAAVILHEMLAGAPPWAPADALAGRTPAAKIVELPASLAPEVATPLAAHLRALAAPDAAARPRAEEALAAARELVELLRAHENGESSRLAAEREAMIRGYAPPR